MSRILESLGRCLDKALSSLFHIREVPHPSKKESTDSLIITVPTQEDTEAMKEDWRVLTSDLRKAVYRVVR